MPTVTWRGEEGVKEVVYEGVTFVSGEPTPVDDEKVLAKVSQNGAFKVEGWEPTQAAPAPKTVVPPSQQTVPGPVEKPGDPVPDEKPVIKPIPKV